MKVKIGKYLLTNDSRQYLLSEVKIAADGKNAGNEVISNTTYYPTIAGVLNALLELKIKSSDATTLSELKESHAEAVAWINDKSASIECYLR